jgi:hypothetical protein
MLDGSELVIKLNKNCNKFYNYTDNCQHWRRKPASFRFAFVRDDLDRIRENSEIKDKSNGKKIITCIGK